MLVHDCAIDRLSERLRREANSDLGLRIDRLSKRLRRETNSDLGLRFVHFI